MLGLSRDLKKSRRRVVVLWALVVVVSALSLTFWTIHTNAIHRIEVTRTTGRQATCDGFEAFTNALIVSTPPPTDETARTEQQTRIDAFEADLEARLAPLGCDLHLLGAN